MWTLPAHSAAASSALLRSSEGRVDIRRGQPPGIVEIGDDFAHETLVEAKRRLIIPEMIGKQCQGELRRAGSLVGPLEPRLGKAAQVETRRQRFAVDGYLGAVEAARAFIDLH